MRLHVVILLFITLLAVMGLAGASETVELYPENFNNVVLDPKRNVFVLFYARWCGHCRTLKPTWDMLAHRAQSMPDTVIARIDADLHAEFVRDNLGSTAVQGFPTLILFTKSDKSGVLEYEGQRDFRHLEDFLKAHMYSDG